MNRYPTARCRACLEELTMTSIHTTCPWCGSGDTWPEGTLVYQALEVRVAAQPLVESIKEDAERAAKAMGAIPPIVKRRVEEAIEHFRQLDRACRSLKEDED